MTKFFLTIVVASFLVGAIATAQNQHSAVGTWKMDVAQSDFGSEPAPKDVTIVLSKDTPEMLSWRVNMVDEKGKASSYSWHGAPDGTMHPVMQNGKSISKQSAKWQPDGALLRHGEDPDGSSFDARSIKSEDGNSMTDEITSKSKDGKETRQKFVFHRVKG